METTIIITAIVVIVTMALLFQLLHNKVSKHVDSHETLRKIDNGEIFKRNKNKKENTPSKDNEYVEDDVFCETGITDKTVD